VSVNGCHANPKRGAKLLRSGSISARSAIDPSLAVTSVLVAGSKLDMRLSAS
jgi:hypothetical protein